MVLNYKCSQSDRNTNLSFHNQSLLLQIESTFPEILKSIQSRYKHAVGFLYKNYNYLKTNATIHNIFYNNLMKSIFLKNFCM